MIQSLFGQDGLLILMVQCHRCSPVTTANWISWLNRSCLASSCWFHLMLANASWIRLVHSPHLNNFNRSLKTFAFSGLPHPISKRRLGTMHNSDTTRTDDIALFLVTCHEGHNPTRHFPSTLASNESPFRRSSFGDDCVPVEAFVKPKMRI